MQNDKEKILEILEKYAKERYSMVDGGKENTLEIIESLQTEITAKQTLLFFLMVISVDIEDMIGLHQNMFHYSMNGLTFLTKHPEILTDLTKNLSGEAQENAKVAYKLFEELGAIKDEIKH